MSSPTPVPTSTSTPTRLGTGVALAVAAMTCVGSSVAAAQALVDAPLFTVQALRYAAAAALLGAAAAVLPRFTRSPGRPVPLPRPRGGEWGWLLGVALVGLVLFNVGVVRGVAHAEPAVIGVAVAAVPLVLALAGPLTAGGRPGVAVVAGAVLVTVGAVLVTGGGRTDAAGLGWAVLVLACEVGFTLLAVPVLARLGPWAVSLHSVWMAAVVLSVLALVVEGPAALTAVRPDHLLAAAHLAVVVTALAFVLWYSAVRRIGPGRAGLATGVVPVTAAVGGLLLGGPVPSAAVWSGTAVVAAGLAVGLRPAGRAGVRARTTDAPVR